LKSLKGCCYDQPIFDAKLVILAAYLHFIMLAFRYGLQYCNSDFKRLNGMNFSAFCRNLVRFGPVTPEFTLKMTTFAAIQQKSAYQTKYFRICWTDLYQFYRFCEHMGGDGYPDIRLAAAQGTLLWQPVKFGFCSETLPGMCRNLVRFVSVTPELKV